MITSDLEELNIDNLRDFEGEPSYMVTENPRGLWKRVVFDPKTKTKESTDVLTFHENKIVSTDASSLGSVELTGAVIGKGALGSTIETELSPSVPVKSNDQVFDLKADFLTSFNYLIESEAASGFDQRASKGSAWVGTLHDFNGTTPTFAIQSSDSNTFRWEPPVDVSPEGEDGKQPFLSVDGHGNGMVIWSGGGGAFVEYSYYDADTNTWSAPYHLSGAVKDAQQPRICLNDLGQAVACWEFSDGKNYRIQATSYDPSTKKWASPVDISPAGIDAAEPRLAIDIHGNAVALWTHYDASKNNVIQGSVFDFATKKWAPAVNLSKEGTRSIDASVGMDGTKNAWALWTNGDGAKDVVQSARYDGATSKWSAPVTISKAGEDAFDPFISVHPNGKAIAVWTGNNGEKIIVKGAHYDEVKKVWETPVDISTVGLKSYSPQVSMDALGNAVAVWFDFDGTTNVIHSSVYDPKAKKWSTPTQISPQGINAQDPKVSLDTQGRAVAIWSLIEKDKGIIVQSSTYQLTTKKWSKILEISEITVEAVASEVSLGANRGIAVWSKHNGTTYNTQAAIGILRPFVFKASDDEVSLSYRSLKEVADPVDESDAATKNYVDNKVAELLATLKKKGLKSR